MSWIERPELLVDASLPPRERFAQFPSQAQVLGRELLRAVLSEVPAAARPLARVVDMRTRGRFGAEARAVATRFDVDWRDVMLAAVSYDLAMAYFGCSTIALPTADGPVLARNLDWWPEDILARASYVVRTVQGGALRHVTAAWPGSIGVATGVSARGFALVINAVSCPEGISKLGYPVLLHLRRVLEDAGDFDEALERVATTRLVAPCLITLVGRENDQRVVVERTPTRHALRWAEPGEPLFATNDYRLLYDPAEHEAAGPAGEIYATTCGRFSALRQAFAAHRPEARVSDQALLEVLSHPRVIQTITAQHVVMRPRDGSLRLYVPSRFIPAD